MGQNKMFRKTLQIVPFSSSEKFRNNVMAQRGGKIVLSDYHFHNIRYAQRQKRMANDVPITLRLTVGRKMMHCGILEFSHNIKNEILVPDWFLTNLEVEPQANVKVSLVKLEEATSAKFESTLAGVHQDDAVAALVQHLQNFTAITQSDKMNVAFRGQDLELTILEVEPANAARLGTFGAELNVDLVTAAAEEVQEEQQQEVEEQQQEAENEIARVGEKRKAEQDDGDQKPGKRAKTEEEVVVDLESVRAARLKIFESKALEN